MTRQRRKEMVQAIVLFAAFGVTYHVASGFNLMHELSHAIVTILQGGTVYEFSVVRIVTNGKSDLMLYAGTFGGIVIRMLIALYLLRSRRSLIIPAFIYGRVLTEWVGFYLSMGSSVTDYGLMTFEGQFTYTVLHSTMTLGILAGATILAVKAIATWDRKAPKQMENPSLFRRHAESRW